MKNNIEGCNIKRDDVLVYYYVTNYPKLTVYSLTVSVGWELGMVQLGFRRAVGRGWLAKTTKISLQTHSGGRCGLPSLLAMSPQVLTNMWASHGLPGCPQNVAAGFPQSK